MLWHIVDVIHVEKNVCDMLRDTSLDTKAKQRMPLMEDVD